MGQLRRISAEELVMARELVTATMLPGSWDKRFARSMAGEARNGEHAFISDRQAACLRRMVRRYRRQLPAEVVELAIEPAPEFEAGTDQARML